MPSTQNVPNQSYIHSFIIDQFHLPWDSSREFIQRILVLDSNIVDYVFQLEKGDQKGILHFQGFLKLRAKKRSRTLELLLQEKFPDYRIRVKHCSANGREALRSYCMKEDTRVSGPWGKRPIYQGQDLEMMSKPFPWQQDVIDYIEGIGWNDRQIMYIWEPTGNVGKSKLVKWLCFKKKAKRIPLGNANQLKANVIKQGQAPCYLVDLPRTLGTTEKLCDLYSAIEEVKNGFVSNGMYGNYAELMMMPPRVVVFSNYPPWKPGEKPALSVDKWMIRGIKNKMLVS